MFCPNCGKSIPEDVNFCPYCGENIEEYLRLKEDLHQKGKEAASQKEERKGMRIEDIFNTKINLKKPILLIAGIPLAKRNIQISATANIEMQADSKKTICIVFSFNFFLFINVKYDL